jgi:DNA-directed RNA polymerase subunit omega
MARVTIEDCLEQIPGRFALVLVAAQRTRQLLKGAEPKTQRKNREAVVALREIASGMVFVEEDVASMLEQAVETDLDTGPSKY